MEIKVFTLIITYCFHFLTYPYWCSFDLTPGFGSRWIGLWPQRCGDQSYARIWINASLIMIMKVAICSPIHGELAVLRSEWRGSCQHLTTRFSCTDVRAYIDTPQDGAKVSLKLVLLLEERSVIAKLCILWYQLCLFATCWPPPQIALYPSSVPKCCC